MRLLILLFTGPVLALTTAYVSFDHPENWKCELSQGVWICQSTLLPDRKESIILSIAALASEWDSIDNYEKYLKEPKTIQDEDGNSITSEITYTRKRNINGVIWVDSLQHNSELPGFWARYLATVQNKLAILITYIVSDEKYSHLAPQFDRMVGSLKPTTDADLTVPSSQGDRPLPGPEKLGPVQQDILHERLNIKKTKPVPPPNSGGGWLVLLLGGAGAYLYFRWRRKLKVVAEPKTRPQRTKS